MKEEQINVLVACEISQVVMQEFRKRGCNAYSCDTQCIQAHGDIRYHIPGDCTPYLDGKRWFYTQDAKLHHVSKWHLIIAHPPCTYICKIGSPWLISHGQIDPIRLEQQKKAVDFFYHCLQAKADFVAVENPLPQARAGLPRPTTYVDPSWYGHKYTKKTLLWLKNLPPLMPAILNGQAKSFVRSSRGKYRSRTFTGIAVAMAEQWIPYIKEQLNKNR